MRSPTRLTLESIQDGHAFLTITVRIDRTAAHRLADQITDAHTGDLKATVTLNPADLYRLASRLHAIAPHLTADPPNADQAQATT